jgi:hypothetical protein
VIFYYFDSNGNRVSLGSGAADGQGGWTVRADLPAGTYTLFAQAEDSYDVFSDPLAISLQVL